MCSSFHHSIGIAVELKHRYPGLHVWMGGPHVSANPRAALARFPEIDAVFVGEAEATLRDVSRRKEPVPLADGPSRRLHEGDPLLPQATDTST